ncbi:hypothetical protein JCM9492_03110 [Aquifex pyrophilus]
MKTLFVYNVKNLIKVKWLWAYFLFLFLLTSAFFYLSEDITKVSVSILNLNLLIVPLISSVFTTTYFYDSQEFIKFLLTQPISRRAVLLSNFLSLYFLLAVFYLAGTIPVGLLGSRGYEGLKIFLITILSGVLLTGVFVSLSLLVSVFFNDRVKGMSFILALWTYLTILHDGLILLLIYIFKDYPLEKPVSVLIFLNPVDVARLLVVLNLDIAALLGISGLLIKNFLGSALGLTFSLLTLILWILVPLVFGIFIFNKKDL